MNRKTLLRATEPPAPGNLGNSALLETLCPTFSFLSKGDRGGFPKGKKGRGLVPGKTKSDAFVAVTRVVAPAGRRTHPLRFVDPRTPVKGVFTGRN